MRKKDVQVIPIFFGDIRRIEEEYLKDEAGEERGSPGGLFPFIGY